VLSAKVRGIMMEKPVLCAMEPVSFALFMEIDINPRRSSPKFPEKEIGSPIKRLFVKE